MQDILRKTSEDKRRGTAGIYSIILIVLISSIMLLGSGGETDTDLILEFDPVLLLVVQGFTSILIFIGIPLVFIGVFLKIGMKDFFPRISWITAAMTFLIAICSMIVISVIGEWNLNLDFGNSDFANWARASEDQLKILTEHLTNFTSFGHFILAFFIVAVIPGIGEELLFRGLIQNNLRIALKNHHIAIWLTGFIFAAIHLQFFGLAPRMFLGVLFGYLYHWSGKLTIAMLAHLINNGMAIIVLYLAQQGTIEISPEEMEQAAPWPALLIFGCMGVYLMVKFKERFSSTNE